MYSVSSFTPSPGLESTTAHRHSTVDLSASEYDFSTTDIDAHSLDASRLSPLDSTIWCNDWLDPSWPQDSTTALSLQQSGTEPSPSSVDAADVAKKKTDQGPMPTPTPTIPTKCNCVQLAIEALEKVTAWAEVDDFQLAHSALAAHKDLLTQCEAWLACTRCSSPSSVVMLILVITDKLITSFRHIHAFSQQSSAAAAATTMSLDDRAGSGPSSLARSGGGGGAGDVMVQQQLDRRISLGDYQIDSSGEWSLVMNVLLSSQLSRLGILFTKLWTRLNSSKEESQVQIIQQQQDRLRTFMTHLKRSTPCSGC
ncbi:hypothetical protein GTA08_BOTSDO01190 [Neofusicoccum parvum]|nr:hypothetical protein GTA08_BOTSDO01190 [Neofusicoccum parvum]